VSSNSFAAKSVEQMRVEQSQFEQFTPTRQNVSILQEIVKIKDFFSVPSIKESVHTNLKYFCLK
jgi:hypothetical protein